MKRATIKRLAGTGSRTHFADALDRSFEEWQFDGRSFEALSTPLVALCGAIIESAFKCVEVVIEAPTCQKCMKKMSSPLDY